MVRPRRAYPARSSLYSGYGNYRRGYAPKRRRVTRKRTGERIYHSSIFNMPMGKITPVMKAVYAPFDQISPVLQEAVKDTSSHLMEPTRTDGGQERDWFGKSAGSNDPGRVYSAKDPYLTTMSWVPRSVKDILGFRPENYETSALGLGIIAELGTLAAGYGLPKLLKSAISPMIAAGATEIPSLLGIAGSTANTLGKLGKVLGVRGASILNRTGNQARSLGNVLTRPMKTKGFRLTSPTQRTPPKFNPVAPEVGLVDDFSATAAYNDALGMAGNIVSNRGTQTARSVLNTIRKRQKIRTITPPKWSPREAGVNRSGLDRRPYPAIPQTPQPGYVPEVFTPYKPPRPVIQEYRRYEDPAFLAANKPYDI